MEGGDRRNGVACRVFLTKDMIALVDPVDLPLVDGRKWQASKGNGGYYARHTLKTDGKNVSVYMHRVITGCPRGYVVDHRNGDTLDNRRRNLRIATVPQNASNVDYTDPNTASQYRGVSLEVRRKGWRTPWRARVRVLGVDVSLGFYEDEVAAARAVDLRLVAEFGEFAHTNFDLSEYMAPGADPVALDEDIPF